MDPRSRPQDQGRREDSSRRRKAGAKVSIKVSTKVIMSGKGSSPVRSSSSSRGPHPAAASVTVLIPVTSRSAVFEKNRTRASSTPSVNRTRCRCHLINPTVVLPDRTIDAIGRLPLEGAGLDRDQQSVLGRDVQPMQNVHWVPTRLGGSEWLGLLDRRDPLRRDIPEPAPQRGRPVLPVQNTRKSQLVVRRIAALLHERPD